MTEYNLDLSSIVYDDAANTLTLTMRGAEPEPPDGVRQDLWYPARASFTVVVPIKKGTVKPPSGVYYDADKDKRFKVTHNGSAWGAPVPVED